MGSWADARKRRDKAGHLLLAACADGEACSSPHRCLSQVRVSLRNGCSGWGMCCDSTKKNSTSTSAPSKAGRSRRKQITAGTPPCSNALLYSPRPAQPGAELQPARPRLRQQRAKPSLDSDADGVHVPGGFLWLRQGTSRNCLRGDGRAS